MSKVVRTKFATDILYRLWDDANSRWVIQNGRHIWSTKGGVSALRDKLIAEGRNPDTLHIERVTVKVL